MKFKILYAVLLLGAISQLNGSYYWNRINYFNRYRSQCAKYLCKNNALQGSWIVCMDINKYNNDPNRANRNLKTKQYFMRDCYGIGGSPKFDPNINLKATCNRPRSGYFNRFVCGYN
jgi:hypothetical protein